jgi:methyl-accepting chemotaxis protein
MSFRLGIKGKLFVLSILSTVGLVLLTVIAYYSTVSVIKGIMTNDIKTTANALEQSCKLMASSDKEGYKRADFKQSIYNTKIGKSGYVYMIDAEGTMVVHHKKEGKNYAGKGYIDYIRAHKDGGVHEYTSATTGQHKIVAFRYIPEWKLWVIPGVNQAEYFQEVKDKFFATFGLVVLIGSILMMSIGFAVSRGIQQSLDSFMEAIDKLLHNNQVHKVEIRTNDEVKDMADKFNLYLDKIEDGIKQDEVVIEEVNDVLSKVKNGFYTYQVKANASNKLINELRDSLNSMIKDTKDKIDRINHTLEAYGESRFDYEINRDGMNGNFGSMASYTKLVGGNVSELLAMILNTGESLNKDIQTLSTSIGSLAQSSNTQAVSLEETSATLEEVTSRLKDTVSKSQEMAHIAQDTRSSANSGKELATMTATAMEEINNSTSAINEAIAIIDQIAFQTNILSLNAAVEAATAGEAGKGFAVVAGEVRNLAGRSAEAAKDIKELVEQASTKALEGKNISTKMMNGFEELNEKITTTSELVDDVARASSEQLHSMDAITSSISSVDIATQENAKVAREINRLTDEVSHMSDSLVQVASRAEFNPNYKNQVCDIGLVYETAQVKLDYIKLKDTNYEQVGMGLKEAVECRECFISTWIDKNSSSKLSKSSVWNDFSNTYSNIQSDLSKFMQADSSSADNSTLKALSTKIEDDTNRVFEYIDVIKRDFCANKKS